MTSKNGARAEPRYPALRAIGPIAVAAVIALSLLRYLSTGPERDLEDAALSEGTSSYFAKHDGFLIHCRDMRDAQQCVAGMRARNGQEAVLWFGNSQLHAVNQMRAGEEPAPPILFRKLLQRNVDLLTFSQPNATMLEHYVLFEHLRHHVPVRAVVLPVVFDDFRDQGVRTTLRDALTDRRTRDSLNETEVGKQILTNYSTTGGDLAGLRDTVQYRVEQELSVWLEEHSMLWSRRGKARGKLFLNLFRLRNSLFGITPQSKRLLLKGPYRLNMRALDALLASAHEQHIRVLVYIVPLRNDVAIPYVTAEYERFKQDVRDKARAHQAVLADLEDLVPAEHWGAKQGTTVGAATELDFMHFQSPGHVLLASEMERLLVEHAMLGAAQ